VVNRRYYLTKCPCTLTPLGTHAEKDEVSDEALLELLGELMFFLRYE
jgi:hypothetical protein